MVKTIKEITGKLYNINILNFCMTKETINKSKRQATVRPVQFSFSVMLGVYVGCGQGSGQLSLRKAAYSLYLSDSDNAYYLNKSSENFYRNLFLYGTKSSIIQLSNYGTTVCVCNSYEVLLGV